MSDIEKAVIGCVLMDDVIAFEACHRVGVCESWFSQNDCRIAWLAMEEMKAGMRGISPFLLYEFTRPNYGEMLAIPNISKWIDLAVVPAYAQHYSELLKKEHQRRASVAIANKLQCEIKEGNDPEPSIAEAQSELNALNMSQDAARPLKDIYDDIIKRYIAAANKQGMGLLSPWQGLNLLLNGWQGGEGPYVLAARPGCGKSTLMTNDAKYQAANGRRVSISSQEMSEHKLRARMLCDDCDLNTFTLDQGKGMQHNFDALWRMVDETHINLPIRICETPQTIEQFAAWATNEILKHGSQIIYLDYLQIILPSKKSFSRNEEVSEWMRMIRKLDKHFKSVPFVILSQLNRGAGESARRERPTLRDLRDSGSIEQDAAGVVFIHERVSDLGQTSHEIGVEKNRFGPQGWFPIEFNKARQRFENVKGGAS